MSSWNLFVAPDVTIMHVDYMRSQSREATLPSEEDEQKPSNTLCISYPRILITFPTANQTEGLSWSPKAFVPPDWIGYELPDIVNCSARTGLDTLEKHCADAIGFDIIYFLPDSEDDFDSYTEFLRYMGDRNLAGVAKFDNGTTLFLVPPS
nr:flowering time control protein FPA-like [Tanacetum cinerariifolium]